MSGDRPTKAGFSDLGFRTSNARSWQSSSSSSSFSFSFSFFDGERLVSASKFLSSANRFEPATPRTRTISGAIAKGQDKPRGHTGPYDRR